MVDELYLIMEKFLKVEYQQKSLLYMLNVMDSYYTEETSQEIKFAINNVKIIVELINDETRKNISMLDNYIVSRV